MTQSATESDFVYGNKIVNSGELRSAKIYFEMTAAVFDGCGPTRPLDIRLPAAGWPIPATSLVLANADISDVKHSMEWSWQRHGGSA